jgi:hypothetical protein
MHPSDINPTCGNNGNRPSILEAESTRKKETAFAEIRDFQELGGRAGLAGCPLQEILMLGMLPAYVFRRRYSYLHPDTH